MLGTEIVKVTLRLSIRNIKELPRVSKLFGLRAASEPPPPSRLFSVLTFAIKAIIDFWKGVAEEFISLQWFRQY